MCPCLCQLVSDNACNALIAQGAYYMTCPCHRSIREGKGQKRLCKKEITVTTAHPEEKVVRMMAWWLLQGFWLHYCRVFISRQDTHTQKQMYDWDAFSNLANTLLWTLWSASFLYMLLDAMIVIHSGETEATRWFRGQVKLTKRLERDMSSSQGP